MNFLLLLLFCGLIVQQSVAVSIGSSASSDSSTKSPCLIYCSGGYKVEYENCTCIPDTSVTPSYIWSSTSVDTPSDTPAWTTPCSIYCPYFFKIDQKNCTCILDTSFTTHIDLFCPSGYEPDYQNGRCSPMVTKCNIYCPADAYISDYENCKCISIPTTTTPTMPSSTDEPLCLITCNVGEYLDTSNCYCIPDSNYDATIKCKIPKSCPALMSWSVDECRCICSGDLSCKYGYVIDENLCKCVLEPIPFCAPGFNYSFEECSCVCANLSTCPPHSIWDPMLCECVCNLNETCSSSHVFDAHVCDCVCEVVKKCANGFHFDDETCSCSCSNVTSCSEGFMWDHVSCKCVEVVIPICPPGFTYSPDHCDCICTEQEQCTGLKLFDELLCKCICPVNAHCTYGHFNAQLCLCEFDQTPPTPPYPTPITTAVSSNTLSNDIID